MAGFLALNILIFAAWRGWLGTLHHAADAAEAKRDARVYAGLLSATQIVLAEIALGAAGELRFYPLVGLHLGLTGMVASAAFWRRQSGAAASRPHASTWRDAVREMGGSGFALAGLSAFLVTWMTLAAWLLPPRGVDDLAYHLPPLLEAVQTGKLTLLDVSLRRQFAMPMAGDFLALWPVVFFHALTWADLVQFVVACFGAVVLAAMARSLGVRRADAAFIGALFLYVPVVMGQSGSVYVDVTLAVSHFVLVYAALRYWQQGAWIHLVMAGLAAGFGLGVKYSMLAAIAFVQPLIWLRLWRDGSLASAARRYAVAIALALVVPAYWLVRNYITTGFAFYPYELGLTGLTTLSGTAYGSSEIETGIINSGRTLVRLLQFPGRFLTFLLRDPGLGTLNGGLGGVFWGCGVPALGYCLWRAVAALRKRDLFPMLFWGQAPLIAALYLFQTDVARLAFNQRLVIALSGFALLALGVVLPVLRAGVPGAAGAVRGFAVLASVLATVHLAGYTLPSFQIRDAVMDRLRDRGTSPYRYHRQAAGDLPTQSVAWDALDFLTLPDEGWHVYLSAPWNVFFVTPAYGTRVQNRVWNFQSRPGLEPDAIVFHFPLTPGWEQWYLGRPITPDQTRANPRWELIAQVPSTQLWVRRDQLAKPDVRARLLEFYRRAYGDDIKALRPLLSHLPATGRLATATAWGPALKYFAMTGELRSEVALITAGDERGAASRSGPLAVLTVAQPLPGAAGREIGRISTAIGDAVFFVNEL
jgi:hypothetical protein